MVTFNDYIQEQRHRDDAVGELARHAITDEAWPQYGNFGDLRDYLVSALKSDFVPALDVARQEFFRTRSQR